VAYYISLIMVLLNNATLMLDKIRKFLSCLVEMFQPVPTIHKAKHIYPSYKCGDKVLV